MPGAARCVCGSNHGLAPLGRFGGGGLPRVGRMSASSKRGKGIERVNCRLSTREADFRKAVPKGDSLKYWMVASADERATKVWPVFHHTPEPRA